MRKRATKRLLPIVLSALVAVPALEAVAYWCDRANAECTRWEYPPWGSKSRSASSGASCATADMLGTNPKDREVAGN